MTPETHFIDLAGGVIHARIDGEPGRPWLTALHALGTDMRLWDAQVAAWQAHFRVLRLDLRGHGRSPAGAPGPNRIGHFSRDVIAVWDKLGIDQSVLAGLSIGGMIALDMALAHPTRILGVLAVDCRADAPPPFRAIWDERRALLARGGLAAVADATLPTWFTPATLAERPDLVAPIRAMIEATSPDGYIAATLALQHLDLKRRLSDLAVPITFVVGDRDGVHPQAMTEMAALTPHARLATIADAAHLSNIEQPEAFAVVTLPFLQELARDAAPSLA